MSLFCFVSPSATQQNDVAQAFRSPDLSAVKWRATQHILVCVHENIFRGLFRNKRAYVQSNLHLLSLSVLWTLRVTCEIRVWSFPICSHSLLSKFGCRRGKPHPKPIVCQFWLLCWTRLCAPVCLCSTPPLCALVGFHLVTFSTSLCASRSPFGVSIWILVLLKVLPLGETPVYHSCSPCLVLPFGLV